MRKIFKVLMITSALTMSFGTVSYANSDIFYNLNDVEQDIYKHLQNRDNQISFIYVGDKSEFKNNISKVITDSYLKDDYTERSWIEIKPKASVENNKIDTTINVKYLTTKEQEDYVDSETKKIVTQIIKPNMTDLEKVRAINDYLINRFDYDYTLQSNNAYSALTTGKATCQGYSMTAYKMLTYAGLKNRIVIGSLNGDSHSWNYVMILNKWCHLDITNNDSTKSNKYFLVDDGILNSNNYMWNKANYSEILGK